METELYNPFQNSFRDDYNVYANTYWSPDGALLIVRYEKHYYDDNYDLDSAIYSPSGEIFRQYANMSTSLNNPWSPTQPHKILFIEDGGLCILEVVANEQACPEAIANWADNQNVRPYNFIWSPDGNNISFMYSAREERVNNNGLCYIELATEEIFCPITSDDLQLEEQIYPQIHFWSNDGRYVILFLDKDGIDDVRGPLAGALVNSDGRNLQVLGRDFSWPYENPWRPFIPSPAQE